MREELTMFAATPPGAGDAGFWASLAPLVSEPLTDTFGISGFVGVPALDTVPGAAEETVLRAPGGTYALALLTTAPYLYEVGK